MHELTCNRYKVYWINKISKNHNVKNHDDNIIISKNVENVYHSFPEVKLSSKILSKQQCEPYTYLVRADQAHLTFS